MEIIENYKNYWSSFKNIPIHPIKSYSIGISFYLIGLFILTILHYFASSYSFIKIINNILFIWSLINFILINNLLNNIPKGLMADIGNDSNFIRRFLFLGNLINAVLGIALPIIIITLFFGNIIELIIAITGLFLYTKTVQRDYKQSVKK